MTNLINRIWLGGKMPQNFADYGREWQQLNPEWKLQDWNDDMVFGERWINQHVIDSMTIQSRRPDADMVAYYTHVADVVDYELIWRYGGWYLNTDLKPLKPLSALTYDMDKPAFAMEDDHHLVNMAMYSPPGDPFIGKIIELLPKRYFGMPGAYMNATTGVQLIMQAVAMYKPKLTVFHRDVFNPVHFTDFGYGEEPNLERAFPDETVAVHLWGHRSNMRGQRILET